MLFVPAQHWVYSIHFCIIVNDSLSKGASKLDFIKLGFRCIWAHCENEQEEFKHIFSTSPIYGIDLF